MDLAVYLVKNRILVKEFARQLEISRPYLSDIKNGKCIPSPSLIQKIVAITNGRVTSSSWKKKKTPLSRTL